MGLKHIYLLILIMASARLHIGAMDDTRPLWRLALGGQINSYPAQGPTGDVYVIADDRAIHSINPQTGQLNWTYRPGGRLNNFLLVTPDGTIYVQNERMQIIAVTPGGNGRWILSLKIKTSSLPAASDDGRLLITLEDGTIFCISRFGEILWQTKESAESSAAPISDNRQNFWIPLTDGRIIVFDPLGKRLKDMKSTGVISVLALDVSGRIWAGSFSGQAAIYSLAKDLSSVNVTPLPTEQSRVSAIHTDFRSQGTLFYSEGDIRKFDVDGQQLSQNRVASSSGNPVQSEKTLFITTPDGSINAIDPEGEITRLQVQTSLFKPLLTSRGILISGGKDWILYGWKTEYPAFGWNQFRGGPSRTGAFQYAPYRYSRKDARRDKRFLIREQNALSSNMDVRLALIEELESFENESQMYQSLPWANLLLEDLVGLGTIRYLKKFEEPMESYAIVRERAYTILGQSQNFRIKNLLMEALNFETDPRALATGFLALGNIGSDWDGKSTRLIAQRFEALYPQSEQLTIAAVQALANIIRYNGSMPDKKGTDMLNNLIKKSSDDKIRASVLTILQNLFE